MYFISSLSFGSLHSSLSLTMSSQPLPPGPTLTVSVSALYRSNPGASWSLHWIPLEKTPSSLGTVSITFVFWCRWSIELFVSESRQGAHPKLWFQVVPLVFSPSHIDSFGSLNWKTRRVTILAWGFHFCSILEHAHFFWFYYYYFVVWSTRYVQGVITLNFIDLSILVWFLHAHQIPSKNFARILWVT